LPPVGGISLAAEVMQYEEAQFGKKINEAERDVSAIFNGFNATPQKCINLKKAGVLLFERAKYIKLTEQHRSKDPDHTALLKKMSIDGSLHPRHLKKYKSLSKEDMTDDGEFSFATMVVTGNAERHELNALQAKRWASKYNTKVVRWLRRIDFDNWKGRPIRSEHQRLAMENDCFHEMFVPGAAGYITENINTDIGLANGVEIKYHSLSFGTEEEDNIFNEEFESDGPLVMTLDEPPSAINVELFADFDGDSRDKKKENKKKRKEWKHGSLVDDGRVVIQISSQWGRQLIRKYSKETIGGSWQFGYSGSTVPMKDHFPLEPAFSITIYKAQVSMISFFLIAFVTLSFSHTHHLKGRTIRRLIIFLSQHPIPLLRMTWEGLYVALSRVKYRDHVRLALKGGEKMSMDERVISLKYMGDLRKNKYTDFFFRGFRECPNGGDIMFWDRNLACEKAGFKKKVNRRTNRGAATKKRKMK